MIEINEQNYESEIELSEGKVLFMFHRESGCSQCKTMMPIFEEFAEKNPDIKCARYSLSKPDSVTEKFQFKQVPAFFAFVDGKVVGAQEGVVVDIGLTFTPEKIAPKQVPVEKATMLQLMTDEANMIDQIAPLMAHLKKIQKEMKKRRSFDEPCCDSCAAGGGCSGGNH
jgi:thioredoxin-like negative regulator of GroEL